MYIDFYNKILSWCALLKNISLRKQTFLPAHCRNVCFYGLQKRAHQKHLFWFIIQDQKAEQVIEVKPYGMYVYTRFVKPMHQSSVGINNT